MARSGRQEVTPASALAPVNLEVSEQGPERLQKVPTSRPSGALQS